MEELLTNAGLTESQATVYLFLIENGESSPPAVAQKLKLTRTNAYKVLDNLVGMGLVRKTEVNKKFVYSAEDPIALSGLVAAERNRIIALEHSVRDAMHQLRATYEKTQKDYDVRVFRGNPAVTSLYVQQAKQEQPIYFIKSRADIPTIGFETMDRLRRLPAKAGTQRYGITPDVVEANLNPAIDKSANLARTWVHADDYTSPVEWAVSGDELLIIDFEREASAVRIKNPAIAGAFKELWHLLDRSLRQTPEYKKLPKQARRKI